MATNGGVAELMAEHALAMALAAAKRLILEHENLKLGQCIIGPVLARSRRMLCRVKRASTCSSWNWTARSEEPTAGGGNPFAVALPNDLEVGYECTTLSRHAICVCTYLGTAMRYMAAFVILASLVLPAKSATANVLSPADYENFHNLDLKMLTVGDGLYALITNRPAAQAPDCLMQLAFKFDAVQADLHSVGTLVALAANMADNADELRVIQYLSLASWRFLEQVKYHRLILNSMMSNCAEDGAVAKSQEISHTWSDATSLVQSIVKKIGAGPP